MREYQIIPLIWADWRMTLIILEASLSSDLLNSNALYLRSRLTVSSCVLKRWLALSLSLGQCWRFQRRGWTQEKFLHLGAEERSLRLRDEIGLNWENSLTKILTMSLLVIKLMIWSWCSATGNNVIPHSFSLPPISVWSFPIKTAFYKS